MQIRMTSAMRGILARVGWVRLEGSERIVVNENELQVHGMGIMG